MVGNVTKVLLRVCFWVQQWKQFFQKYVNICPEFMSKSHGVFSLHIFGL